MNLVLASTSPYRRTLLARLGCPFATQAPDCDEQYAAGLLPDAVAQQLAVRKAESVRHPGALIIGSDQVVDLDGEILGKPGSAERAVAQLLRLSGRAHRLLTAVAVHDPQQGRTEVALDVHVLHMQVLTPTQAARYVALDAPLWCAGSYMLEKRGIALFERIIADPEIADDTAVQGLPLAKLCRLLRDFGYDPLVQSVA